MTVFAFRIQGTRVALQFSGNTYIIGVAGEVGRTVVRCRTGVAACVFIFTEEATTGRHNVHTHAFTIALRGGCLRKLRVHITD